MNKVILTGRVEDMEKTTFKREDQTEGFVGTFKIKLNKRNHELVKLKTFEAEVWAKIEYGKFVYVEGYVKGREYEGKWYSNLTIYEIEVIDQGKKFKKGSTTSEIPASETPSYETPDPDEQEELDEEEYGY